MTYSLASTATGAPNWGATALLALLTVGAIGYAAALLARARAVVRQGRAGVRERPWPLIGLLRGTAGLAIAVSYLASAWLAGPWMMSVLLHTHGWTTVPMLVCGYVFLFTAPGRRTSAVDHAMYVSMWAHPRQSVSAFAVAASSWLLLPLLPLIPAPVRFVVFMLCLLALLVEIGVGYWWWWRRGGFIEIADGERVRLVPTALLHPVFWGWVWGTVFAFLLIALMGEMRASP